MHIRPGQLDCHRALSALTYSPATPVFSAPPDDCIPWISTYLPSFVKTTEEGVSLGGGYVKLNEDPSADGGLMMPPEDNELMDDLLGGDDEDAAVDGGVDGGDATDGGTAAAPDNAAEPVPAAAPKKAAAKKKAAAPKKRAKRKADD